MDVFRQTAPEEGTSLPNAGGAITPVDPRLKPTPDFGTLGPDSDFAKLAGLPPSAAPKADPAAKRAAPGKLIFLQVVAGVIGMVSALLVSHGGGVTALWDHISGHTRSNRAPAAAAGSADVDLDRQRPQRQAEILLERAVNRSAAASHEADDSAATQIEAQIEARAPAWRGKIRMDSQLGQLTTAALNSNDRSLQASAVEVQIAAYGLSKNDATVDMLVRQAGSGNHAQRIWALWTLGLMGNRGVQTDRVVQVLQANLKTSGNVQGADDADARRWAVEGLALVGTTPTIVPLLEAMHDDPSPLVRERAAASLAESGTLSHEQRMAAVPKLIHYTDDPALDAQTRGWAFQALGDITKQRLPNDPAAWREWYRSAEVNSQ